MDHGENVKLTTQIEATFTVSNDWQVEAVCKDDGLPSVHIDVDSSGSDSDIYDEIEFNVCPPHDSAIHSNETDWHFPN
jgi:hypothetical protein